VKKKADEKRTQPRSKWMQKEGAKDPFDRKGKKLGEKERTRIGNDPFRQILCFRQKHGVSVGGKVTNKKLGVA